MHVPNLHTLQSMVEAMADASMNCNGSSTNPALNLRISRSTVVDTIAVSKNSTAGYRTSS